MKRMIRRNKIVFVALFLFIAIGFAYLTRVLGNSGNNFLKSNDWDIHFENIRPLSYSIEATSPATIDNTGLNIDFSTTFNEPGEKYAFYVDVVNDGTIPGMIELITKSGIPDQYSDVVSMSVLNLDESEVKPHQLIDDGDRTKLLVIVTYEDDISEEDLLPADSLLDLGISIEVIQADENAVVGPMNLYKTVAFNWKQAGSKDSLVGGNGIFRFTSTQNNSYPVYYYSRDLEQNFTDNVIFGGFCWRIVRTTDTGGVKLMYNGSPVNNKCENIDPGFNNTSFNTYSTSLGYHGYMYGTNDLNTSIGSVSSNSAVLKSISLASNSYYFASSVEIVGSSYQLVNPVLLGVNDIDDILTTYKYTFASTSSSYTGQAYYVVKDYEESTLYAYQPYYGGSLYYSDTISYYNNSPQLVSPTYYSYSEWPTNNTNLIGKYVKPNNSSSVYYVTSVSKSSFSGMIATKMYKYANGYTYENGVYSLTGDIQELTSWEQSDIITNHRFFCLNRDTTCENLAYIYELGANNANYIILSEGRDINGTLAKIYENTNNSLVKQYVDSWYANNLINYEKYIEDTPYCNDRRITSNNFTLGGSIKVNTLFAYSTRGENYTLTCNKNDAFTVTESDTGNGDLTYPIGLITADELELSGGASNQFSPLYTTSKYWTMTPYYRRYDYNYNFNIVQCNSSYSIYSFAYGTAYTRPVISVNSDLIVVNGNGTGSNPYQLYYLD